MLNLSDLRVESLQSEARDHLLVCFQEETADASPACGIGMTGAFFISLLD